MAFESFKKFFSGSTEAADKMPESTEALKEKLTNLEDRKEHILSFVRAGEKSPDDARILDELDEKIEKIKKRLNLSEDN